MDPRGSAPPFSTDRYTSEEFLKREMASVFRTTWIVAGRESEVARPGARLAVDELGESLFLVRGDDGEVRTFRNTCRHRGTRLVDGPCEAARITCPYHGWTYGLDGRLVGVPGLKGFADLDRGARGLVPVRTERWGGFVWITFDAGAPPVREYLGELADQLEPYRLSDMRPIYKRSWELPCNWKAVLDNATESYHLRAVHGQSIAPHIDALPAFSGHDSHHLQTIPIADYWWRPMLDRQSVPRDLQFSPEQLRLFRKYVIFPNTLINVLPYHLTVFRVFPLTADTCRFHYEFHARAAAGPVARLRAGLTLLASLYILREDLRVLERFQAGARVAGGEPIPFHREEQALEYFHRAIDRHVAEGAPAG